MSGTVKTLGAPQTCEWTLFRIPLTTTLGRGANLRYRDAHLAPFMQLLMEGIPNRAPIGCASLSRQGPALGGARFRSHRQMDADVLPRTRE